MRMDDFDVRSWRGDRLDSLVNLPGRNSSLIGPGEQGKGSKREVPLKTVHITDKETGTWWLYFTQGHAPVHAGSWVWLKLLSPSKLHSRELAVAVHTWNSSSEEAEAGGWWVQGQARLCVRPYLWSQSNSIPRTATVFKWVIASS